jgi:uncharacterized membrane protein
MDDLNKKMTNQLLYTGVGFIILSSVFAIAVYFKFPGISQLTTFVASLISSAGVALIIIALVESRHLQISLEEISKKIIDHSARNLHNEFEKTFEILEHSKYNGLIDILPPRLDEERGECTREIIASEIKKSKSVRIFSISGLDFFGAPGGGLSHAGKSFDAIMGIIDTANEENKPLNLEIKALLMHPTSEAAKFRDQIESFDGRKGNIWEDIKKAEKGIKILNQHAGKKFIKYLLYSIFPQASFVLTDSYIFVEPYHYAPTKELSNALKEKGLRATTLATNCTGGRIPIFQFSSNSSMYVAMQKHFDSIWKYEKEKQKQNKSIT